MIKEPNYLLGIAFTLLVQARQHMIKNQDSGGLELIEDGFQGLKNDIENTYYKKDSSDGR